MAAAGISVGQVITFDATTDTYTDPEKSIIEIKAILVCVGKTAGTVTLEEGWDGTVADASGEPIFTGWLAAASAVPLVFPCPVQASKGLKCTGLTTAGCITVYLA